MKCHECGAAMKKKMTEHPYAECGLKNIFLKNVEQFVCPQCKEEELVIPNLEQLHQLIARIIASQGQRLLAEEIRFLRSHLGFSGIDFAKAIGVAAETVSRWENGREEMKLSHERLLRILILGAFGPIRDYLKELPNLGAVHEKKIIKRIFKSEKNRWREAA